MSKVLKIRVGRSGKKKRKKKGRSTYNRVSNFFICDRNAANAMARSTNMCTWCSWDTFPSVLFFSLFIQKIVQIWKMLNSHYIQCTNKNKLFRLFFIYFIQNAEWLLPIPIYIRPSPLLLLLPLFLLLFFFTSLVLTLQGELKSWCCCPFSYSCNSGDIHIIQFTLRVPLENIVCYLHIFENNLGIKRKFTTFLKGSLCLTSGYHFSFQ